MIRKVNYNGKIIEYNLQWKNVKNINLRIKSDLTVNVSANKRVKIDFIDNFVISKGNFILSAQKKFAEQPSVVCEAKFSVDEFQLYITECFEKAYLLFRSRIKSKPMLKLRTMTSCWGTCNYVKNIITLNTNLIYCTKEQIFYVIVHEFAHLLVHNHSKDFYNIVEEFCKDYKEIRKSMRNIQIKRG